MHPPASGSLSIQYDVNISTNAYPTTVHLRFRTSRVSSQLSVQEQRHKSQEISVGRLSIMRQAKRWVQTSRRD